MSETIYRCSSCGDEYTEQWPSSKCGACDTPLVGPDGNRRDETDVDQQVAAEDAAERAFTRRRDTMPVVTTDQVAGQRIIDHLGIVAGEAIEGANMFSDVAAKLRDTVGGRSVSYERKLEGARQSALHDLRTIAADLGADGVVGVRIGYEPIGTMLMVTATGTAVSLAGVTPVPRAD